MPRASREKAAAEGSRQKEASPARLYTIEFYAEDDGSKPVLKWIKEDLSLTKKQALGTAMREILEEQGAGVCKSEWGKQLGDGIFEFRLRMTGKQAVEGGYAKKSKADTSATILLRVFCHAIGNKIVLLLAGYDKGKSPGAKRQRTELELARKRLRHATARARKVEKEKKRQQQKRRA